MQINERKEGMARAGHQRNNAQQLVDVSIIPYSVGMLQAYVQQHAPRPERYTFLLPVYRRMAVADAVADLLDADIVGFSMYVWNANLSLAIARELKRQRPDVCIVFGGPQVPDAAEAFLREHSFIDMACHGEGEVAFLDILEQYQRNDWSTIPSISYLRPDGTFKLNARAPRVKDLPSLPSPYLSHTFKPLMEANPNTSWIMLWETNRGCPFSCSFCDWGSAVNAKVHQFDMTRLYREMEWCGRNKIEIVFCCDANFGMLTRDEELAEFAVLIKKAYGTPRILTVQNTKNATERAYRVQRLLADARMNPVVTLSLQSLNDATLEMVNRKNISTKHFQELQNRYTRDRVATYTDVILAMPGETYDTYLNGISDIIRWGQHHRILFYNLSILPNAEMGSPAYQQRFGLKVVPQEIINMHSSLDAHEAIPEYLETVIATQAMPEADWRKAKAFWWITELFYFNHWLKIPLLVLSHQYGLSMRSLLEPFLYVDPDAYPTLHHINTLMEAKATRIQAGDHEWLGSQDWLGVYWTVEQYVGIDLVVSGRIPDFFQEAEALFTAILDQHTTSFDGALVHEVIQLSQALVRLPGAFSDRSLELTTNLWDYFQSLMTGQPIELIEQPTHHVLQREKTPFHTLDEWLEHQIHCQNFKSHHWYDQQITVYSSSLNAVS